MAITQQAAPAPAPAPAPAAAPAANPADDWVRPYKAVLYMHGQGFEMFNEASLRHYAYRTDLMPKPKRVGKYAYYRLADLDTLIERL